MAMTHGECLAELWDASRSIDTRRSYFVSLAHSCMEQAAAGIPCVLDGTEDYPAFQYVFALWTDASAELMSSVFAAYVRHGYIDPNATLVANDQTSFRHFRALSGLLPLVASINMGNLHTAEHLVAHGASTDIVVADVDFFTYVRNGYGRDCFNVPSAEVRQAAAARLIQAAMGRHIASSHSPAIEPVARRRRAHL